MSTERVDRFTCGEFSSGLQEETRFVLVCVSSTGEMGVEVRKEPDMELEGLFDY